MLQAYLLRFHRWISVVFALPLIVVILTGLVLSFQPMVQSLSIKPGTVDAPRVAGLVKQFDPDGKARGLSIDPYANRMRLQMSGAAPVEIDLATGAKAGSASSLGSLFQWARRTHERLISGFGWLVTASTIAMLVVMLLGVLMGLPRLRNTVSGWHKGMAWGLLPLLVLSPLTGLFLAFGVTLGATPPVLTRGKPIPLTEAVQLVGATYDLSGVSTIGQRGGRMLAIVYDGGGQRSVAVTPNGLVDMPRNWSRSLHEGTWSAVIASVLNVMVSLALMGLLGTGLVIWSRRTFRRRPVRNRARATAGDRETRTSKAA
jgi:uncharacterized iron-regulated membrane protein